MRGMRPLGAFSSVDLTGLLRASLETRRRRCALSFVSVQSVKGQETRNLVKPDKGKTWEKAKVMVVGLD